MNQEHEDALQQPATYVIEPQDARRGVTRQVRRALREYTVIPVMVVLAFGVLAALSIVADQTQSVGFLNSLREWVGQLVGKKASTAALQAIAGGLVTVTSITFSVLLLAVQQTASSLSPVVFDQFRQRRTNQAYLGFFVGLALFSYVVVAAVQDETPPILGAAIATVLTIVALMILLMLVYSTITQMRATNVLSYLHDLALRARAAQADLLSRTLRESASQLPVQASYVAGVTGYLNGIDVEAMERPLGGRDDVEISLHVALGDPICYGDTLASVRAPEDYEAQDLGQHLAAALEIRRHRDVRNDPTTGVDQIANIAWSNGSTAKHNPEVAREALAALKDLSARWVLEESRDQEGDSHHDPRRRVVYADNHLDRMLNALYSMLVVGYESRQYMTTAAALDVYSDLLGHLQAQGSVRERILAEVDVANSLLDRMVDAPVLRAARRAFAEAASTSDAEAKPSTGGR